MRIEGADPTTVRTAALAARINFRYRADGSINIALDETTTTKDVEAIVDVFAGALGKQPSSTQSTTVGGRGVSDPTSPERHAFLTHPVFNSHHSETEMMRYIRNLERKDIGLGTSMIPLGSCTMKLNAASEMLPVTWPEFSNLHPFAPIDQAEGISRSSRSSNRRSARSPDLRRSPCSRTRERRASSPV